MSFNVPDSGIGQLLVSRSRMCAAWARACSARARARCAACRHGAPQYRAGRPVRAWAIGAEQTGVLLPNQSPAAK
ncbi:hypothetical protein OG589_10075 [Sphaerisporangium sp. NBC_01403]|uniref:hypothetical protein n=1 Tax=Sphaerisporangium sp. NBC_01403 TaxID=2903599 RepID=UPI00324E3277